MYDIIIVGAGPAGLTAAIYALRSNKKVLILEKESIGGQMSSSPLIENYPGFLSISGSELSNNLYNQVIELGGQVELEEVLNVENTNEGYEKYANKNHDVRIKLKILTESIILLICK